MDDSRFGSLSATIASVFGAKVQPRDFMMRPPPEKDPAEQEHDEMIQRLQRVFAPRPESSPSTSGPKL